jgi:hypothetical protein
MTSILGKTILNIVTIQIQVISVFNLLDVLLLFLGLLDERSTTRVGASMRIVTLLSTIVAPPISLVLGASLAKIANLCTFETCRGASIVIGYCLFGCIDLLRLARIIMGITLFVS